jgi:hypothetical protein
VAAPVRALADLGRTFSGRLLPFDLRLFEFRKLGRRRLDRLDLARSCSALHLVHERVRRRLHVAHRFTQLASDARQLLRPEQQECE